MEKISRALISVSDKRGVVELARGLQEMGVEILSTGGTAGLLQKEGIRVISVSDYTGFPEILGGRVKTLQPRIHGGILARRGDPAHVQDLKAHGILPIDLVVVNLYPFIETVARAALCALEEAIETIDIGGPSMIRAAAKNFTDVAVVVDPEDYPALLQELRDQGGTLSRQKRFEMACKAFEHTARYDSCIASYFRGQVGKELYPSTITLALEKVQDLRYGENPHQSAAFYREMVVAEPCLANARQLQGKELSYNNIVDLDAALALVKEFTDPTVAIIKHTNPCGVARGGSLAEAYAGALETDPVSAFGGIVAVNRALDRGTAAELSKTFYEAVVAPGYEAGALEVFSTKKNLRVLEVPPWEHRKGWNPETWDMRKVAGGYLLQQRDLLGWLGMEIRVVTRREPTPQEWQGLEFVWLVSKHVKSNAIVYGNANRSLAIGAGQMSRVDSCRVAAMKARGSLRGAVMASDAFFPFRDGIDEAASVGITAVVQPGGSIRDQEVIEAANEHGMAMVFTGVRHFKH
ncbi:MAG: bifunctional phosphoribosylaminoimidazolecarboxamide formyltransferase/IMP cyclohydrolase [Candidatus Tectomicrobia bacterium]|uniref:Bifunctional purine biosynthesis protein PurH n=1 Tax=Tectimicrobiota bacterium TaxID=2528274 RepID=A0A932M1U1_UNCTE|nr:bifunctional phosphoribosylaminoimidazolecarboxamide formyltransferase/IMP cyclohydrolase [Candidatus Tectomicrobia bacterium]